MLKYLSFLVLTLALMACRGGGSDPAPIPVNHTPVDSFTGGTFRALKSTTSIPARLAYGASSSNTTVQMTSPRTGHRGILNSQGKIVLIGGEYKNDLTGPTDTSTIDIFDPISETFNSAPINLQYKYTYNRFTNSFDLVNLPDGRILVAGGYIISGSYVAGTTTVEVVNTDNTISVITDVFPEQVSSVEHAFYIGNNKVFFYGLKLNGSDQLTDYGIIYDLVSNTSQKLVSNLYHVDASAIQRDNDIIFLGGSRNWGGATNYASYDDVVRFNPSDLSLTKLVGTLSQPKHGMGSVLLSANTIGLYGGFSWQGVVPGADPKRLAAVEVVDLSNLSSVQTIIKTSLLSPVSWLTSVSLQGTDYTLHAGGVDDVGFTSWNEYVHNSVTNQAGSTGTMTEARRMNSVISLNNGLVLISGGGTQDVAAKNTAEIYDSGMKLFITFTSDQIVRGSSQQFSTTYTGGVDWSISPEIVGTNITGNTIDANGLLTTNANNSEEIILVVKATAKDGSGRTASVRIRVL